MVSATTRGMKYARPNIAGVGAPGWAGRKFLMFNQGGVIFSCTLAKDCKKIRANTTFTVRSTSRKVSHALF